MTTPLTIVGLTDDDFVPGAYGVTNFGTGQLALGTGEIRTLLIGAEHAAASPAPSKAADDEIQQVTSEAELATFHGQRSMLARMGRQALAVPGVDIWTAPVSEGTVGAYITLQISGSWTTDGTFDLWFGNVRYQGTVLSTDDIQTAATRIAGVMNDDDDGFGVAVVGEATTYIVTYTVASLGSQGNQYYARLDTTDVPSGCVVAITGGSALDNGAVPFTGGTTDCDVTDILAVAESDEYDYIVCGFNDTTNAGLVADHVNSEAGPLIQHLEHAIFASNDTYAAGLALSQTELNEYRCCVVWKLYDQTHPSEVAAEVGALRAATEASMPNIKWAGQTLSSPTPETWGPYKPTHTVLKNALKVGLTPLETVAGGDVQIVRGVVSHCLNGASLDTRCQNWAQAIVPDRVRKRLCVAWDAHAAANPYQQDDPAADEPTPPAGRTYPTLWNGVVNAELLDMEDDNWLVDVADHPPVTQMNESANRMMTAVPVAVLGHSYQVGIIVNQIG